jgi:outer membrane protein OmpA-like peptidoglycan-associated protein
MHMRVHTKTKPQFTVPSSFQRVNSPTLQRCAKKTDDFDAVPPLVHETLQAPGQTLDPDARNVMESRMGHDFSRVRIHSGTQAAASAHAVNAQAYTVGQDMVFGAGQYTPTTPEGQNLLAHELTHTVQQRSQATSLQRRLMVDRDHPDDAPSTDPARRLTPAQRFGMMDILMRALCSHYRVNSTSGEVESSSTLDPAVLATGSNATGCCCLNIITDPAVSEWTIELSQTIGPHTRFGSRQIYLQPTNSPLELGSYTASGDYTIQGMGPVIVAGHEICGHAALEEIRVHPANQDRTTTDVHDPTVRIENLIASEQGVPASEQRGLAASGPHRGESTARMTIRNYRFNGTDIPAAEQTRVRDAARFIRQNERYVDILGHSDNVGSPAAKQQVSDERAIKVKNALINIWGVPRKITQYGLTNVDRFTRVEGVSDTQPPPSPLNINPDNWRRAEIYMVGFPAGAQNPPPGTPTTVTPHTRRWRSYTMRYSTNPCIRHLTRGAYP